MEDPMETAAEDGRKSSRQSEELQQSHRAAEDAAGGSPARRASGLSESSSSSADPVRNESTLCSHFFPFALLHSYQTQLYSSSDATHFQVLLVKQCTVLGGITEDKWTEEHSQEITKFLQDASRPVLLLYTDQQATELCISSGIPPTQIEQASYFVRVESVRVTGSNFHRVLQMGTVHGGYVDTLLRVMHGLYAPNFFENTSWPDSILPI